VCGEGRVERIAITMLVTDNTETSAPMRSVFVVGILVVITKRSEGVEYT